MQRILLIGCLGVYGIGCEPSCEQTCEVLLDCDETHTDRLALDDCTAACLVQERLYDDWEDTELRDSFTEYKTCVTEESCQDIADGICYDEELYSW